MPALFISVATFVRTWVANPRPEKFLRLLASVAVLR